MSAAVVVENLAMAYGSEQVLDGVSFEVRAGEVFALLGSNGAGKTTTVEILEGHRRRTGGEVRVLGTDPSHGSRAWRDRLGIVLQSTAIDPDLTVLEAARLQASYHRRPIEPADALDLLGLSATRRQRVGVLSGGQRRRLDLALAIVGRPELIFLDEPTTGFDPEARHLAWDLVDLLRRGGSTVVLTTHYLDEVERLADRIGILDDGHIVALGTPTQLGGADSEISFVSTVAAYQGLTGRFGATIRSGRIVITSDDPTRDLNRLTALSIDRGWPLEDLRVGRPDLERVFLEVVGDQR